MLAPCAGRELLPLMCPRSPWGLRAVTGKAQILLLLWKWDYFTKCQRQKGGGLGFRFQKEEGQEEESGMSTLVEKGPEASAFSFPSLFPQLTVSVLLKSSLVIIYKNNWLKLSSALSAFQE